MTLAAAFYTELLGDAGVSALASDRVYPTRLPQLEKGGALSPSVAFALTGRTDEHEEDGIAVKRPRFGVFCVAESYDTAHALADAVEACLMPSGEPFIGTLGGVGGVAVQHVSLSDAYDLVDQEELIERGWHAVAQEYEIWLTT